MCCLLSACGSKGDLYLPVPNPTELEDSKVIPIPTSSQENSKTLEDPTPETESESPLL